MPYNSSPGDVRQFAGGISTADRTDADIIEEQEAARDIIDAKTGRTWASTDANFELIVRIENLLAAGFLLSSGGPQYKTESEHLWTRGMSLLDVVLESDLAGTSGTGAVFASSDYESYILGLTENENMDVYRSTWLSRRRGVTYY